MVQWLEIPANYNIIAGNSTKGKKMAHGEGTTKISIFKSMAEFVHTATVKHMSEEGFFDPTIAAEWEPKQCQSRWNFIFRRYRAARFKLDNQTGFGLTEEMVAEGKTVEDLAEESCPCFGRIDDLFGGNPNVTHPSEMSGPIYNDADWFPIRDGWPANRNSTADKGEQNEVDAGSSQSDVVSQVDEEYENVDPNIQLKLGHDKLFQW
ncbi:hypothetical protein PHMEG_00010890 [Phytophthora megakarya]|uniref:Uncharacterized protein n=1 Tax=Phytophthora megakarya TaxID=4795 RepID=A0A225WDZ5_9STRA|nr:hypothetical protein PHMEG_00010890 [Phytophthora megakarya]